jgi:hypothetical protein
VHAAPAQQVERVQPDAVPPAWEQAVQPHLQRGSGRQLLRRVLVALQAQELEHAWEPEREQVALPFQS